MLRMIIEISVPRTVHKFDQISNIILKCCALSGDNGERNVQYHTSTRFFHLQSVTQCCRDRSRTSWEIRELGQKPAEIETKSVVFNFQSRGVHFQSCTSADAVLILGALWTSEASTDLVWLGPWKPLCIPFTCIAQWCSVDLRWFHRSRLECWEFKQVERTKKAVEACKRSIVCSNCTSTGNYWPLKTHKNTDNIHCIHCIHIETVKETVAAKSLRGHPQLLMVLEAPTDWATNWHDKTLLWQKHALQALSPCLPLSSSL